MREGVTPMTITGSARFVVLGVVSLLYVLLTATTFNSLGQVLPSMVRDLGMSWAQAGFGFTLLGVACGIASLAPAFLIRAVGVGFTLLAGTILLMLGFAALAWTTSVIVYHLGTVLLGLGFCFCGSVPAVHVISTLFERRSTALGIYFTCGSLGSVAGPIFFYVANQWSQGWRGYWLICAAAALVVGGLAAFVTARAPQHAGSSDDRPVVPDSGWTLRGALATPQLWVVIAAYTGCLLVNTTVHSFAFQHLMEHGQTAGSATAWISLAALVGAAGAAAAGVIGERVDGRRLTMLSLLMLGLTSASLVVAQGWIVLVLFAVSMGVGLGFSYVGTALLLQDYFGRRASLELYSMMTVVSTSAAIGPGIGGMVRDRSGSFSPVFAGLAIVDLLLLLAVLLMRRPVAQAPGPVAPGPEFAPAAPH